MDERNEISVELRALSELVSGISRQTPYEVPVGYFQQLPPVVMSRVAGKNTTFRAPEGYFDGFAAQVLARIKTGGESVGEELARLSATVSGISREMPYRLPEGYFDELSYFEELSPLLTVALHQPTYQVPEGYFAGLPERILEKVTAPVTAARVIPMDRDQMRREGGKVLKGHWWKYSSVGAIAACLLLIFSWPQVGTKSGEGGMTFNMPQALQNVSDQEMQTYLDDQHTILAEPVNNSTATLDMNEGEVKSLLGEVSDDDLQQYMEEHGKADDLATN
jgi:hypothetical protein